jgi:hypothetical protein
MHSRTLNATRQIPFGPQQPPPHNTGYRTRSSLPQSVLFGTIRTARKHQSGNAIMLNPSELCEIELQSLPSQSDNRWMLHKQAKKEPKNATYASVTKGMAKPRMAKSTRIVDVESHFSGGLPKEVVQQLFPNRQFLFTV